MSSHYKKEVKVRKYKDYTEDDLSKCLEDVKSKKLTQEKAAAKYGVTKLKGKHDLKPGKIFFPN